MDEYIKQEAAVKAANEWVNEACKEPVMRVSRLFDKLQKVPAADVAPVVHGRWIYEEETLFTLSGYRCSVCRWPRWLSPDVPEAFRYCPNCGAKMDGGDNNEAD